VKVECSKKLIKTEKITYLPEGEFKGVDIGKCDWDLLQVAHCSGILDRNRKWPIRHVENPTEEE